MNGNNKDKILQDWKLSSSGIPLEKVERLKAIAYSFGASWVEFDSNISVLICTKVGSIKTRAAQQLNIPLVHPDWLLVLDKFETPMEALNSYRLKPLQGLFISVTGLSLETRRKVEQVCISLGASYSGDLSKACTHLIGLEPKGLKYEFALKCKMHIVSIDWLWSCQKLERLVDETPYKLTNQPQDNVVSCVEQVSSASHTKRPRELSVKEEFVSSFPSTTASLILLSCRIYLLCCTEEEIIRGNNLLRLMGATRSTCLFSPLTHIVFGSDRHASDVYRYRELIISHFHSNVRFVTFEWLHCCVKNSQLLYDGPFRISLDDLYPMETFSLRGVGNVLSEENSAPVLPKRDNNQNELFSSNGIFRGLRFRFHFSLLGMEGLEQELSKEIQKAQGVLVQDSGIPTHLIVCHGTVDNFPEKVCIVTSYWVKACLRFHRLLSPQSSILFRPLQWRLPLETMIPCKITLSGFHNNLEEDCTKVDYNRENIKEIIHLMGATYLERLSRRHTTHLIVECAESEKYQMALKWGIPVVRLEWLFACFQSGTRVPLDRYRFPEEINPVCNSLPTSVAKSMNESTHAEDSLSLNATPMDGKCRESENNIRESGTCFPLWEASTVKNSDEMISRKQSNKVENDWIGRKRSYWNEDDKWDAVEGLSQVVVFEENCPSIRK